MYLIYFHLFRVKDKRNYSSERSGGQELFYDFRYMRSVQVSPFDFCPGHVNLKTGFSNREGGLVPSRGNILPIQLKV